MSDENRQIPDETMAELQASFATEDFPEDPLETYDKDRTRQLFTQFATEAAPPPTASHIEDYASSIVVWKIRGRGIVDQSEDESIDQEAPKVAFTLTQFLGQGGFGEVWEAIQGSLGRMVALKRQRDDPEKSKSKSPGWKAYMEELFRQEALVTAALEHPNIVPIYDMGIDDDGRPHLAMKIVRGEPWDRIIRRDKKLSYDDFLSKHVAILIDVAQAVAFAHSRGIIHRDLKPGQVMVGEFGEVLLMDWGLALLHDAKLANDHGIPPQLTSLFPTKETATSPSGTLAFMAPEQASPTADDLGPHTDVFLLGGTLYYLLTGRPPYVAETTLESFARARLGDVLPPSIAAEDRDIPRELEEICMRALAPEPESRTPGAGAFVTELQDYLSGSSQRRESRALTEQAESKLGESGSDYQSLRAGQDLVERARELWPQNPSLPALTRLVHYQLARTAIANGDLVLARMEASRLEAGEEREGLLREVDEREEHLRRIRRQRRVFFRATVALMVIASVLAVWAYQRAVEAQKQRRLAETARAEAENAMNFLITELRKDLEPLGQLRLLGGVVGQAEEYYMKSVGPDADDGTLRRAAMSLKGIGDVHRGEGDLTQAQEAYASYNRIAEQLSRRPGSQAEDIRLLADSLNNLGFISTRQGDLAQAMAHYQKAADLMKPLVDANSTDWKSIETYVYTLQDIANVHEERGELAKAADVLEETLQLSRRMAYGPGHEEPDYLFGLANTFDRLGRVQEKQGKLTAALESFESSLDILERLRALEPDSVHHRRDTATALFRIGKIQEAQGDLPAALKTMTTALTIRQRLSEYDPLNRHWQELVADSLMDIADIQMAQGENEEALAEYTDARDRLEKMVEFDETNRLWKHKLALAYQKTGKAQEALGQTENAEKSYESAEGVLEKLTEDEPENQSWIRDLAVAKERLAALAARNGNLGKARTLFEEGLEVRKQLVELDPTNVVWMGDLAASQNNLGYLYIALQEYGKTEQMFRAALSTFEKIAAIDDSNLDSQHSLAMANYNLAGFLSQVGQIRDAESSYERALEIMEALVKHDATNVEWQDELSSILDQYGNLSLETGNYRHARDLYERDLQIQKGHIAKNPEDANRRNRAAWDLVQIGAAHEHTGESEEATAAWEEAVELMQPLVADIGSLHPDVLDTYAEALLFLGRVDEAKPALELIWKAGATYPRLEELAEKHGIRKDTDAPKTEGPEPE
ncbi:tetratricopeptide repeat protein [bacterium]|nr:tetratricopeptide repeat protein [bacterium]